MVTKLGLCKHSYTFTFDSVTGFWACGWRITEVAALITEDIQEVWAKINKKINNDIEMASQKFDCLNTCADILLILIELAYRGEIIHCLKQRSNYRASNKLAKTNHIA